MFHQRNRGACLDRLDNQWEYPAKVADIEAVQSNGDALVAVPRGTLVSDPNDVSTGGAKQLTKKRTDPAYAERLYNLK